MGQRADAASTTSPRPDAFGVAVWSSPSWRAKALAWIDDALAGTGLKRSGEPEQPHLRPWATVLKVPTANGPVWFKAAAPATAFEVRLYELLTARIHRHPHADRDRSRPRMDDPPGRRHAARRPPRGRGAPRRA